MEHLYNQPHTFLCLSIKKMRRIVQGYDAEVLRKLMSYIEAFTSKNLPTTPVSTTRDQSNLSNTRQKNIKLRGFPKRKPRNLKIKNISNLLIDDKEGKIMKNIEF